MADQLLAAPPVTDLPALEPVAPVEVRETIRTVLRRFGVYLRPNLKMVSLAVVTLATSTVIGLIEMYAIMLAISYVVVGNVSRIHSLVVLLVVIAVAEALLRILHSWVLLRLNERMTVTIRRDLITRLHRLALSQHVEQTSGEWISRVLFEADRFRDFMTGRLMVLIHSVLWFAGVAVFMLSINPKVTAPTLIAIPLMGYVAYRWVVRLRGYWQWQRTEWDRVVGHLTQRLDGLADIRAFGQEEAALRDLDEVAERYRPVHVGLSIGRLGLSTYLEFCTYIALSLLILFGGLQLIHGHSLTGGLFFKFATGMMPMTWMLLGTNSMMSAMGMAQGAALAAGTLAAFVLFTKRMLNPVRDVATQLGEFSDLQVSARRILDILDLPEERSTGTELPEVRGHVRFDHVDFGYRPDTQVLHDISLEVQPGENIAIVGATGAGKTTLMQLLIRLYEPTSGTVTIDGVDLADVTVSSLRRQVVVIAQEAQLFSGTVLENIRFGRPDATTDEVLAAARSVGADDSFRALPRGYDTNVGDRGGKLSLGERQLVALARAMLADPRIVVLDEAVSSVDPARQRAVLTAVRRLLAGRTGFIVAHWLELARDADRVVVMQDGRIVESGEPGQLLEGSSRIAELWQAQITGIVSPRQEETPHE